MTMTKTEIETFLAPLPWRSVVTDAVVYDSLTGTYKYRQQPKPETYNEYWTPMGQPRRDTIENKEKSPRKEKKKKPKPK
jgi:hypothetical protein